MSGQVHGQALALARAPVQERVLAQALGLELGLELAGSQAKGPALAWALLMELVVTEELRRWERSELVVLVLVVRDQIRSLNLLNNLMEVMVKHLLQLL